MSLYHEIVDKDPSLKAGFVGCNVCNMIQQVDSAECLRKGWPKCCGQTVSLLDAHIGQKMFHLNPDWNKCIWYNPRLDRIGVFLIAVPPMNVKDWVHIGPLV